MNRFYKVFIIILLLLIFSSKSSYADSSYVLPYPSFMPGNFFYKVDLIKEEILKYWYYGDYGQFKYNLTHADKYLVEAKTLFEYKQYLLGYASLNKSNEYYKKVKPNLDNAKNSGKDIEEKEDMFVEASLKHIEVLEKMKKDVPEIFEWVPEKDAPTTLLLKKQIEDSINLRS